MSDLAATGGVVGPARIGRVSIGDILQRSARRFADRIALTDGDKIATYAEIDADANRLANYLLSRGLSPGDKISTICNNSIDLVKTIFAIHRAGLVFVPINTLLSSTDMRFILTHAEVRFAVIDDNLYAQTDRRAVLEELGLPLVVIDLAGGAAATGQPTFASARAGQPAVEPNVDFDERDLAMIMYTSGTTSRPKGAMHCHLAVVMAAMSGAVEWGLQRNDGITGQLPLFHCAGHVVLLSFLVVGGKVALMRGFDPAVTAARIARDELTMMVGLPAMYMALLDHPERKSHDLSRLRLCVYAMAPMSRPLLERCIAELCPNFTLTSGQTEMYPATTAARPERQLLRFGNYWGEATLVNEAAIMDDEGNLLPRGQVGELVHRGPNVMLGYYKDPEATATVRKFGWHHTGDLAMVDEHGEILFIDRKKDMIKSGGENISSVKIEETLLAHPAVLNAAVVGLPHPHWSEAVCAFVKLRPGAGADEAALLEHCRVSLSGFQIPKLIKIVDEMPMTATGKLRKVELRQKFQGHFLEV
ncbi:MAG: AMP-binding protein [Beijerinckiaceae bacterium]